jgi:hypothetical protein
MPPRRSSSAWDGSCRAVAALHSRLGRPGGRDGCRLFRPPGQVGPRASRPVTRAASRLHLRKRLRPQPARRGSPAVRSLPSVARPIRPASYRQPGALARGHAPLSVPARGKVAAQSRAVRIGQTGVTAPACAASSSVPRRVFNARRSLHNGVMQPCPGGFGLRLRRGPAQRPAPVRGRHAARRITRDGQRAARRPHAAPVPRSGHARPSTDAAAAHEAASLHIPR